MVEGSEALATKYKVGTVVVVGLYLCITLVGAMLKATPGKSADAGVNAGLFQGQVVGFFGCCASVPIIVALAVQTLMRGAKRGRFGGAHFVRVLFWVLVALLPVQLMMIVVIVLEAIGMRTPAS